MRIVWKWKAKLEEWPRQPGVLGVGTLSPFTSPPDTLLVGRSGWVAFKEEVKTENEKR